MFRSLKRRLTAWHLVVLAVVLLAYGGAAYGLVRSLLLREVDQTSQQALTAMLTHYDRALPPLDAVSHEVSELPLAPGDHLALLTASGQLLHARGALLVPEPPLQTGTQTYHGNVSVRLLVQPLIRNGQVLGYLRLGRSFSGIEGTLQTLAGVLLLLAPLALAGAWAGGTWLAGKAIRPVAEAIDRERQFTRDASHELRTPIAVILAHAQLGLEQPGLPESVVRSLQVIVDMSRKMADLVGDLLTLGRLDVGMGLQALTFSLADVVDEEVAAMAPLAANRQIRLDLSPANDAALVRGDPARLAQAIRILLDNAVRYAPSETTVAVALTGEGRRYALTVTDQGPGIAADEQAMVFDRFRRLDHGRRQNPDGSGLGLAISRAIVRAHGGDLVLHSAAGQGCRFTLTLPGHPGGFPTISHAPVMLGSEESPDTKEHPR